MNYYPLFSVRPWNNGVRYRSFCILIDYKHALRQDVQQEYLTDCPQMMQSLFNAPVYVKYS